MAQKMEKLPNKTPRPIEGHKPAAAVLRDVVDKVYANAWEAKRRGELVGWSSSKFPIELAKAFDLKCRLSRKPCGLDCRQERRIAPLPGCGGYGI